MRRLCAFAHIQEKYYEAYWREPYTEQEIQDVTEETFYKVLYEVT
jgi:hypothetical protein